MMHIALPLFFAKFMNFPHISAKFINSPIFVKLTIFLSSYFDRDAFMHHALHQLFSTFIVLRPLNDMSNVSATPNNKIVWVTSNESIFRGILPLTAFLLAS